MKFNDKLSHFSRPLSEDLQGYHVCWTQHENVGNNYYFFLNIACV